MAKSTLKKVALYTLGAFSGVILSLSVQSLAADKDKANEALPVQSIRTMAEVYGQIKANYYQDKTESQKYHNEAILNFEKYLECTPSNRVNPMTHLNMANSYLEVSNLVEAEKQGIN